jgi:hypothetical protein
LRVLQVTGHDLILGMDWLNYYSPITYNGHKGEFTLTVQGTMVSLFTLPIPVELQYCVQDLNIQKEVLQGNSLFLAHLFSISSTNQSPSQNLPLEIQHILSQFSNVFAEPSSLPPARSCDHQIHLIPDSKPVNIRPYRFSYSQKLAIEHIIEDLLKK